jgi:hypothetical protein
MYTAVARGSDLDGSERWDEMAKVPCFPAFIFF